MAGQGQTMSQVDGGGGFADAAFRHCNSKFTHGVRRPPSSCIEFFYYTVVPIMAIHISRYGLIRVESLLGSGNDFKVTILSESAFVPMLTSIGFKNINIRMILFSLVLPRPCGYEC
jgi:hypothetical protein